MVSPLAVSSLCLCTCRSCPRHGQQGESSLPCLQHSPACVLVRSILSESMPVSCTFTCTRALMCAASSLLSELSTSDQFRGCLACATRGLLCSTLVFPLYAWLLLWTKCQPLPLQEVAVDGISCKHKCYGLLLRSYYSCIASSLYTPSQMTIAGSAPVQISSLLNASTPHSKL
jgi:hypothetical protein